MNAENASIRIAARSRRARRRVVAFTPIFVLPALALPLQPLLPAWAFMWALALAMFAGFKWLTFVALDSPPTPLVPRLLYLFAWPGLHPTEFFSPLPRPLRPRIAEWIAPLSHVALGLILLGMVAPRIPQPLIRGWVGMVGTILILHFGSFHLLALGYRSAGINARPLMQKPLLAESLADFWGRRWNTAFAALADRHAFRPLARWLGPKGALACVFVGSGLIHELVISVPAGAGHGLPTLFFSLQIPGLMLERHRFIATHHRIRRAMTWLFLVGPVCWLFPPAFVRNVILPMLDSLSALLHRS